MKCNYLELQTMPAFVVADYREVINAEAAAERAARRAADQARKGRR